MLPLFSKTVFYLYETLQGRQTFSQYRHFLDTQWYGKEKLREYQFYRLKLLLEHAHKNVPYYTELFYQHGFNPVKMNAFADFEKLPFLTKQTVRGADPGKFIARGQDKNKLLKVCTGGSTGEALVLYLCNKRRSADMAAKLRMLNWYGVGIGEKRIRLRGVPAEPYFKSRINAGLSRLMNIRMFNAFSMSQEDLGRYVRILKRYKPRALVGYTNAIYLLARFIAKNEAAFNCPWLKLVVAGAEELPDYQREVIGRVFKCPVIISYGSMEGGSIAMECPRGNLHITSDNLLLELVKKDRPVACGEEGEVIVTNLYNYAMPLLRYKQDDVAVLSGSSCPCGRGFAVMQSLKGRKIDFIVLPGGRMIHGVAFRNIIAGSGGIGRFRLVQKEIAKLQVILEQTEDFSPRLIDEIKNKINILCENKVQLDFVITEKIDNQMERGKYKYIVSELAEEYF